jgi:magnesium chelatase family protein
MIASVAGTIEGGALTAQRPFRHPHHSASMAAGRGLARPSRRSVSRRVPRIPADLRVNAEANGKLLEQIAAPDTAGMKLLRDAADAMQLSTRGYHRVLKVARTIADLDGAETIGRPHLAEALAYRAVNDRLAAAA